MIDRGDRQYNTDIQLYRNNIITCLEAKLPLQTTRIVLETSFATWLEQQHMKLHNLNHSCLKYICYKNSNNVLILHKISEISVHCHICPLFSISLMETLCTYIQSWCLIYKVQWYHSITVCMHLPGPPAPFHPEPAPSFFLCNSIPQKGSKMKTKTEHKTAQQNHIKTYLQLTYYSHSYSVHDFSTERQTLPYFMEDSITSMCHLNIMIYAKLIITASELPNADILAQV